MARDRSKHFMKEEMTAPPVFDNLYNTYKTIVFSFAYYLTQNKSEAEDLFQEAWLRIVKKIPDEINMKSTKGWIFTIVANLHKDTLRKKRIRLFLFPEKGKYSNKDNFPIPHLSGMPQFEHPDETEHADIRRDILRAIAGLPNRQRRVFVLKELTGFRQSEISDILGVPIGTVKSLMHRAVKKLRRELSSYNPKRERAKCDVKTLSV